MLRALALIFSLVLAATAFAHEDSRWTKGPQGGHIVDAGKGKQHWELVAKGSELTLYVTDADEKPINIDSGSAKGQVLLGGKTHNVDFKPAGGNALKATGSFTAAKGMKVIVKTDKVGGQSFQAKTRSAELSWDCGLTGTQEDATTSPLRAGTIAQFGDP